MGNIFAKKITNNDGWLWKNKKYYLTDKVNKIIIPGTHDSGAYKLDWLIAGAKGNAVLNTLRMIGIVVPWVRVILNGWTITHNLSPYNQLKLGIRSLDLRMYYDEPTKKLRLAHSLSVMSFDNMLKQIAKWVSEKANSKEFLILQIKTDYGNRKTFDKPAIITKFWNKIKSNKTIFSKLWNKKKIPTYFEMVQAKKNIIILIPNKYHSFANKVGIYPLSLNSDYKSKWPNVASMKKSLVAQNKFLSGRKNIKNKFVDVLATVTTQTSDIIKSIECIVWSNVSFFFALFGGWCFYYLHDNAKRHGVEVSELFKNKETVWWISMGLVYSIISIVCIPVFFIRKCHKRFVNVLQRAIPMQDRIMKIAKKHSKKISIITVDFPKNKFVQNVINMNKKK